MNHPLDPRSSDLAFSVPAVMRVRFTHDVLGTDASILADLLEPSGPLPARVQVWIDQNVLDAQPDLPARLSSLLARWPDRIVQAGSVQVVPGGEAIKNDIHILERMLKVIHAHDLDRRSYVLVIGGGAVLDTVGFAAAIAHRGIRLVRLPTTTLAQADSGVGVKNSVNLFQKKNWLGTFAVPWAVVNDEALLATLPDRDFRCGFSEAVKVALLKDADLFGRICAQAPAIARREAAVAMPIIAASAHWHIRHITQGGDPFEALEARPLDFGHWSAHKLEAMTDFELRHGEAVAVGVAIDTVYSHLVHGLPQRDAARVLRCLTDLGLAIDHPAIHQTSLLMAGLEEFRQHLGGRLTVTMLRAVGDPIDVHTIDPAAMQQAIEHVAQFAHAAP
jgi:3-dehydroquinate synthase